MGNPEHDHAGAATLQLGERQSAGLQVPGSIQGLGICAHHYSYAARVRS